MFEAAAKIGEVEVFEKRKEFIERQLDSERIEAFNAGDRSWSKYLRDKKNRRGCPASIFYHAILKTAIDGGHENIIQFISNHLDLKGQSDSGMLEYIVILVERALGKQDVEEGDNLLEALHWSLGDLWMGKALSFVIEEKPTNLKERATAWFDEVLEASEYSEDQLWVNSEDYWEAYLQEQEFQESLYVGRCVPWV